MARARDLNSAMDYFTWNRKFNDEFINDYIKEKNINSEENTRILITSSTNYKYWKNKRRFGNVKQFTKIVKSVLSSMVDTYENGNFNLQEIDAQETGLRLIGPENGHLTRLLEALFGWSSTFWLHVLYHDVFGKFFWKRENDPFILTSSETVYLTGHLYCDI